MISSGWWGIRSTKLLAARSFSAAQSSVAPVLLLALPVLLLCHFPTVFFSFLFLQQTFSCLLFFSCTIFSHSRHCVITCVSVVTCVTCVIFISLSYCIFFLFQLQTFSCLLFFSCTIFINSRPCVIACVSVVLRCLCYFYVTFILCFSFFSSCKLLAACSFSAARSSVTRDTVLLLVFLLLFALLVLLLCHFHTVFFPFPAANF